MVLFLFRVPFFRPPGLLAALLFAHLLFFLLFRGHLPIVLYLVLYLLYRFFLGLYLLCILYLNLRLFGLFCLVLNRLLRLL